jgi:quercetin dioxygenase-like cupin family protein
MAYENKRRALSPILVVLAGASLAGFCITGASAQDLPPGVTIAANGAFAPPEGLASFQAMTFVIDVEPGAAFPLHSHPGRSQVMVLEGELTGTEPAGGQTVYRMGDSFMEEPDQVHAVTNTGTDTVRLVWTLLLPEGTEPIVPHAE